MNRVLTCAYENNNIIINDGILVVCGVYIVSYYIRPRVVGTWATLY